MSKTVEVSSFYLRDVLKSPSFWLLMFLVRINSRKTFLSLLTVECSRKPWFNHHALLVVDVDRKSTLKMTVTDEDYLGVLSSIHVRLSLILYTNISLIFSLQSQNRSCFPNRRFRKCWSWKLPPLPNVYQKHGAFVHHLQKLHPIRHRALLVATF